MISALLVLVKALWPILTDWLEVIREGSVKGRRETSTMPQWAGSSWYYLRYIDPQ